MPKILIVDDEANIVKIFADFLSRMGFDVIPAVGGAAAVELLKSGIAMDLMVLDMKMPKVTGLDVLKAKHGLKDARPVIIVTGSMGQEKVYAAVKEFGLCREDIVYKPVDLFVLLDEIKKKLGLSNKKEEA
jgi:DNA-binding NtrC family response regulator